MANIFNILSYDIIGILNVLLNPILALDPNPSNPALTVFIIAFLVSLISTVANKYLVDHDRNNEIQNEVNEFSEQLRVAQENGDTQKLDELQEKQSDIMKLQSEMMMNSFKPLIVTYVPIILMFFWMKTSIIQNLVLVLPQPLYWIMLTPLWHFVGSIFYGGGAAIPYAIGWLLWYMICTFGLGQILRKFFGLKQGI
ncbi:MAG: DUF106 domain-containing protein [Methanobrevibacter sp.]|nr:DUF106 domain-containing protein [Methanobrevibacter sp.]